MDVELSVNGMSCGGCAASVERALRAVAGVRTVSVDLAAAKAHVEGDETISPEALRQAVEAAGFDAAIV